MSGKLGGAKKYLILSLVPRLNPGEGRTAPIPFACKRLIRPANLNGAEMSESLLAMSFQSPLSGFEFSDDRPTLRR